MEDSGSHYCRGMKERDANLDQHESGKMDIEEGELISGLNDPLLFDLEVKNIGEDEENKIEFCVDPPNDPVDRLEIQVKNHLLEPGSPEELKNPINRCSLTNFERDLGSNEDQQEKFTNELEFQIQHKPNNSCDIISERRATSESPDLTVTSPTPNQLMLNPKVVITEQEGRYLINNRGYVLGQDEKIIWTAFKKDHLPNLNEINEGVGKHPQYRQTRSYKLWSFLNDMGSDDYYPLKYLPLFPEFADLINNYTSFFEDSEFVNQDPEFIIDQISLEPKIPGLKDIMHELVSLDKKQTKNWIRIAKYHGEDMQEGPELHNFKLLFTKAAFNKLVLVGYPSEEWAARLKFFDRSKWLTNKLEKYLKKEIGEMSGSCLSEDVKFKIFACQKLLDLLKNEH